MRYLMINADDFGMCQAMNAATIGLLEDNLITSATLMPPCPWFVEAVTYAASHPEKCIGVHLTLTNLSSEFPRLASGKKAVLVA